MQFSDFLADRYESLVDTIRSMTQILNVVTRDWIYQASDRRLTFLDGRLADEDQNKIVFFEGRLALAFTGLAKIRSQTSDRWLASTLQRSSSDSLSDALETVRSEATKTFCAFGTTLRQQRLAFVGVGWTRLSNHEQLLPLQCWVSNCHNEQGQPVTTTNGTFQAGHRVWTGTDVLELSEYGCDLKPHTRSRVIRTLRAIMKRREQKPEAVKRVLVDAIRTTAKRCPLVGSSVLTMSLPRKAVRDNASLLWAGPTSDGLSFDCAPESQSALVPYSPIVVSAGNAILEDFTMQKIQ